VRRATLAGLVALGTAGVLLLRDGGARAGRTARADEARRLYLAGIARLVLFDDAGMWRHFRAAWIRDPAYAPVIVQAVTLTTFPETIADELDSLAAAVADAELGACLGHLLASRRGLVPPPPPPASSLRSSAARDCAGAQALIRPPSPGHASDMVIRQAWERFPEGHFSSSRLIGQFASAGQWDSVVGWAQRFVADQHNPLTRVTGYVLGASALHRLGRHAEAIGWERRADGDTRRFPGMRLRYLMEMGGDHAVLVRDSPGDSVTRRHALAVLLAAEREALELTRRGDGRAILQLEFQLHRAERLLDNGALAASLHEWNRLVPVIESVGDARLRARARVRRGRTLVKLGRPEDGEADLLAGQALAARVGDLQWQYEAAHNLLHLYEAAGAAQRAQQAGEAFLALARRAGALPIYQMANHDLAWFHQRRGERERARRYFETVLAYADSVEGNEYWAGEYFELTGDLERADAVFRRTKLYTTRAYAGLSRMAEARGDLARAEWFARAHDEAGAAAMYPEFAPLLPGVLARQGRFVAAAAALAPARQRAQADGQVAAWATLSAELALLDLRRGRLAAAAALADSAESAADRLGLREVQWRAHGIGGLARVRDGGDAATRGLAEVRRAAGRAARMGMPRLQGEVLAWYGEALLASGRTLESLAAFARAADVTDSMAASWSLDPARAGYRSMQVHVSNGALEAVLRLPDSAAALAAHATWSVRRKSRGVLDRTGAPVLPMLAQLRRWVGPEDAILDYVVLDSSVAVLVVTDRGAAVQRLAATPDTLRASVAELVGRLVPRLGGMVDTARAVFDTALAERLYAELLAPIEPLLEGRSRLSIIPDGPLHLLPFDALVISRSPVLQFAVDRYTVSLAPSLSLADIGDRPLPPGRTVAFVGGGAAPPGGGGLEGAGRGPAGRAAGLGPAGVTVFQAPRATERAVRQHAGGAGVLHFAVHARANDAEPAYARLALTRDGDDDGRLHAYEIESLPLRGTLVILSACETGAGRLLAGEGVLSLSRAFLRAGAGGTVATLWPVGSTTADLMGQFYPALARRETPAVALRQAKLALRHGRWSNPFHWAGFTLITR